MALQKTVSGQEGQACRSCEEEMGGSSELQASQRGWRCRLLAVRMEDSERNGFPGGDVGGGEKAELAYCSCRCAG